MNIPVPKERLAEIVSSVAKRDDVRAEFASDVVNGSPAKAANTGHNRDRAVLLGEAETNRSIQHKSSRYPAVGQIVAEKDEWALRNLPCSTVKALSEN